MYGVLSLRQNAGRISSALLDSPKFQVLGTPNETPLCYHLCQDALAKLFVWKPAWSHLAWHSDPPAAHHRKTAGSSKRHPHSTSRLLQLTPWTLNCLWQAWVDETLVCHFLEIYDSRTPHVWKTSLTQGGRIATKFPQCYTCLVPLDSPWTGLLRVEKCGHPRVTKVNWKSKIENSQWIWRWGHNVSAFSASQQYHQNISKHSKRAGTTEGGRRVVPSIVHTPTGT